MGHHQLNPTIYDIISFTPDTHLEEQSRRAAETLDADVVGLDFVQIGSGEWILLEANLSPGLTLTTHGQSPDSHELQFRLIGLAMDNICRNK